MKINEKNLANIIVACSCALMFIWVLPDTIALRNILLACGGIIGVVLAYKNRQYFNCLRVKMIPLCLLIGLFFWVLVHYAFFTLNQELELSEIKGLWLRTFASFLMAIGLGISLFKFASLRRYFYIALFFTPTINLIAYIRACFIEGGLVNPDNFVFFLFAKIETAYFGAIAASAAVGNLIYLLFKKFEKSSYLSMVLWMVGLLLVLISAFVSSTMNGMAIAVSLCFLLALVVLVKALAAQKNSKKLAVFISAFIIIVGIGLWQAQNNFTHKGWGMVLHDAKIALDIDNNLQWQRDAVNELPLNAKGYKVAPSTYIRFAYAAVGVKLIIQHPLGYGSINNSFDGLLRLSNINHIAGRQVHSGWIDFGLAFGIPGLLLIFSSLLSIIYLGLKSKSSIALPWVIVCLAMIPFGLIAEIAYKQYFEATIFFLTLASTLVIFSSQKQRV